MELIDLTVTLGNINSSWESFLDSEGISWRCSGIEEYERYLTVLLLPEKRSKKLEDDALKVLEHGGSVVAEYGWEPFLVVDNKQTVSYPYDPANFSLISRTSNLNPTTVTIQKVLNGSIIHLPFCLEDVWCDRNVEKRYISIWDEENPFVWENLPKIIKKNVRKVLLDVLWRAHNAAGLPLVQKWYWPRGAKSVFSFRADMDAGDEDGMQRFLEVVRPWAKSLSLFVCGGAYVDKGHILNKVADLGAEVGNHTYTHYVFQKEEQNRKNLELTEGLLAETGIQPNGFVGPASFWHPSMYDVLQEKGYEYTSSFGLDHDTLPYFPPRKDGGCYDMVEIPFHCLGDRFPQFDIKLDSPAVTEFFDRLIEKKYQASEPINIYGHPDKVGRLGDYPSLVERICRKALSLDDVWTGNMRDLSTWWRARQATRASFEYDHLKNTLKVNKLQGSADVFWSVKLADNCRYLMSGDRLLEGVRLDDIDKFSVKTYVTAATNLTGEVVHVPAEGRSLIRYVRDWKRELRRHRKKLYELKSTQVRNARG